MKHFVAGIFFACLLASNLSWAQKFCTCQLERLTDIESDSMLVYRASISVFPEAAVQDIFFSIFKEANQYYIASDIDDRQYVYDNSAREVSDRWQSFGRVANLRMSLLTILSEDLFKVHCSNIYLDNKTHEFSTILSSIQKP